MNYISFEDTTERWVVVAVNNIAYMQELPTHTNIYLVGTKHPISTLKTTAQLLKLINSHKV